LRRASTGRRSIRNRVLGQISLRVQRTGSLEKHRREVREGDSHSERQRPAHGLFGQCVVAIGGTTGEEDPQDYRCRVTFWTGQNRFPASATCASRIWRCKELNSASS